MSQSEAAKALGITQPSYADWERRAVSIRPEHLPRLAELLGVSLGHLLGAEEAEGGGRAFAGPAGKLRCVFEEVQKLPRYQQRRVIGIVEDMLAAHRGKQTT